MTSFQRFSRSFPELGLLLFMVSPVLERNDVAYFLCYALSICSFIIYGVGCILANKKKSYSNVQEIFGSSHEMLNYIFLSIAGLFLGYGCNYGDVLFWWALLILSLIDLFSMLKNHRKC